MLFIKTTNGDDGGFPDKQNGVWITMRPSDFILEVTDLTTDGSQLRECESCVMISGWWFSGCLWLALI